MNKRRATWLNIATVLVLLLVSLFGGGALRVSAAEAHYGMQEHGRTYSSNSNCQDQCSGITGTLPTQTKRDEEEQDKEPQSTEPLIPNINPFKFAFIQKITSAVDIVRQLRPPDIFALNCSYRF
ncbi:MAG: hypothetical protein AAB971_00065 [Patescibacteria group bacterium]